MTSEDVDHYEVFRRFQDQLRGFGCSRVPLNSEVFTERIVVAGNQVFSIPSGWTFLEFLLSYGQQFIGRGLVEAEADREAPRHPIAKMLLHGSLLVEAGDLRSGISKVVGSNSSMFDFMCLSWDLFTVADNAELQATLIDRLSHTDQFQGARYELLIAASLIRAGFKVAFENERDVVRSHCEYVATFKNNGKSYSVEVKSRHRAVDSSDTLAGVRRILQKALLKDADHERIVFIDVNLPHDDSGLFRVPWHQEVAETLSALEKAQDVSNPWPQSIVFFSNGTFRADRVGLGSVSTLLLSAINHQLFLQPNPEIVREAYPEIGKLYYAVDKLSCAPREFPGQGL